MVATGAGVVGGMLMQARVEATRTNERNFNYTMVGNTFVPLPRPEALQSLGAFAGAGALAAVGTKLSSMGGALGGAGTVLQGVGLGYAAGAAAVFIMP
ncbi:MAG: hypothetical protein JWL76_612 [Thermoleophilia bacterium]|nr:hypothetical protein [Thermoleophilia bacterium]